MRDLPPKTEWREDGANGIGARGMPIHGRHFSVFGDGIWYRYLPPKTTPWTVYLAVMKRHLKQERRNADTPSWNAYPALGFKIMGIR